MRKVIYLSLLILVALGLGSCKEKSDPEPEKRMRITEIINKNGSNKFIYNKAGCLAQIQEQGSIMFFDYNSENKLIKYYDKVESGEIYDETTYEYQDDFIICRFDKGDAYEKYYTNSEGYMIKHVDVLTFQGQEVGDEILRSTYVWEQGNCVRRIGESPQNCTFDDKKNPFQFQFYKLCPHNQEAVSKNNRLILSSESKSFHRNNSPLLKSRFNFLRFFESNNSRNTSEKTIEFEYKYNSAGYPTEIKMFFDGELHGVFQLIYETY